MTKKKTETGPERMHTKVSASRAAAAVIAGFKGVKTKLAIETRRLLRGYSSLTAEEIARRVTIATSANLVEIVQAADAAEPEEIAKPSEEIAKPSEFVDAFDPADLIDTSDMTKEEVEKENADRA